MMTFPNCALPEGRVLFEKEKDAVDYRVHPPGKYCWWSLVTVEEPRLRTLLFNEVPIRVRVPRLVLVHSYKFVQDEVIDFHLFAYAARERVNLDTPLYDVDFANFLGQGDVCIGTAMSLVLHGELAPDQALWMSTFTDDDVDDNDDVDEFVILDFPAVTLRTMGFRAVGAGSENGPENG